MLRLFNSLSRKIEDFEPINSPVVKMYSCGPTVYQFAHIGNFRAFVTSDILHRVLKWDGYEVKFVMNITDVGHMTNDQEGGGDSGEDKIEETAMKEGKTAWEVAEFYTEAFLKDSEALNLEKPDVLAKATDHIQEQIEMIKKLEEKGYTYETSDGVYFDTKKFKSYGEMSSLDEIKEAGHDYSRVEFNGEKRSPRDFALWKFSEPHLGRVMTSSSIQPATPEVISGKRQMEWESPWGVGFPGWHIECSAMSLKYLTNAFGNKGNVVIKKDGNYTIDIHTGGVDHKEIHHPNEVAQSEGATGRKFVNYWVHTAFMMVSGQKMSKSLGNTYTLYDLEKEWDADRDGFEALSLRYLYLQTHYRQEMNFTFSALEAAGSALNRIYREVAKWGEPGEVKCDELEEKFSMAINDDLNMPKALSVVWELVKSDYSKDVKAATIFKMDEVLGLRLREGSLAIANEKQVIPNEVRRLVKERTEMRKMRKFNAADKLRKEIGELGYEIEDNEKGTKVRKK